MDITPKIPEYHQYIQSYGVGRFIVSEQEFHSPIIITAQHSFRINISSCVEDILQAGIIELLSKNLPIEILIFGTGNHMQLLNRKHRVLLENAKISYDMMNTKAACQTYNVLLTEGRLIAALLIPLTQ